MKKQDRESEELDAAEKPDLTEICSELFTLILQLRKTADFGDVEILRQRLRGFLDRVESRARDAGYSSEDIHQTLFALIAFLDETLIASDWPRKEEWLSKPLQLEYFDRFDAGEEFFTRLEKLRQRPRMMSPVLKVYHLCMALGFRGKYQFLEREKIKTLIEETYAELCHVRNKSSGLLAPHGSRGDEIVDVVTREIPFWVIAVFAVAIGFFFYMTMTFMISNAAKSVVHAVESIL
jgi:type VI secretion system protein ImpK